VSSRALLGAGALAVAALIVVLVIKTRQSPEHQASAEAATTTPSGAEPDPSSPKRMSGGPPDAAALPSPAEVAESKARVEEEHIRSPSHAPQMLDNHLDAQPLREARKAMQKGDYDVALKAAEDALAVEESNNARVMAVMAACSLGNRAKAQAHADKLDDMRKSRVAVRCQKFGIEIKGARPPDEAP
jgi:hypothetical protein